MLLAMLLMGMASAYVSAYLRTLGQATAASACDWLVAIAQSAAVVLALVNVLDRSAAGCAGRSDDDQGRSRFVTDGDEPVG